MFRCFVSRQICCFVSRQICCFVSRQICFVAGQLVFVRVHVVQLTQLTQLTHRVQFPQFPRWREHVGAPLACGESLEGGFLLSTRQRVASLLPRQCVSLLPSRQIQSFFVFVFASFPSRQIQIRRVVVLTLLLTLRSPRGTLSLEESLADASLGLAQSVEQCSA